MITNEVSDGLAGILRTAIVELVRRDGPDLSARQLGVFLTCYLETEAQTVRGLAAKLGVSKPAITRALDRLSEFDLVRRKTDPLDRRSVLVQRTATGMAFLRELRTILRDAAASMRITAEPAPPGASAPAARCARSTLMSGPMAAISGCRHRGPERCTTQPDPRLGPQSGGVDKADLYDELARELDALLAGEPDPVANAANAAAAIYHALPELNWAGFYFLRGDELVLGPFQGRPACVRIALGKGVCGTAAAERRSVLVPDVEAFPGHIACDTRVAIGARGAAADRRCVAWRAGSRQPGARALRRGRSGWMRGAGAGDRAPPCGRMMRGSRTAPWVASVPEDRAARPHPGRAAGDRDLEIRRHPHRQHAKPMPRRPIGQPLEMRPRILIERRHAHQPDQR